MAVFRPPHCTMQSLWMIVASLLFACMGVCVKLGSAYFTTGELVFYRGFVGLLMMALLLRLQGTPYATPHWRLQLSRGVSGTIALMCYFFALAILPLATAVTLNYTSPLFVAVLLAWWLRERVGKSLFAAVGLGFIGVILLLQPTLQPEQWAGAWPAWAPASSPASLTSTCGNWGAPASPRRAPCCGSLSSLPPLACPGPCHPEASTPSAPKRLPSFSASAASADAPSSP
jgi:drug/metabolite transporter (DMT)-like permease